MGVDGVKVCGAVDGAVGEVCGGDDLLEGVDGEGGEVTEKRFFFAGGAEAGVEVSDRMGDGEEG